MVEFPTARIDFVGDAGYALLVREHIGGRPTVIAAASRFLRRASVDTLDSPHKCRPPRLPVP